MLLTLDGEGVVVGEGDNAKAIKAVNVGGRPALLTFGADGNATIWIDDIDDDDYYYYYDDYDDDPSWEFDDE